jgi:deoxyhypusine synthase
VCQSTSDDPLTGKELDESLLDPEVRKNTKCTIFLGYTSNMISSGVRETIR